MSPAVARELRILRSQRIGDVIDAASGPIADRLDALILEIATALARLRAKQTKEEKSS